MNRWVKWRPDTQRRVPSTRWQERVRVFVFPEGLKHAEAYREKISSFLEQEAAFAEGWTVSFEGNGPRRITPSGKPEVLSILGIRIVRLGVSISLGERDREVSVFTVIFKGNLRSVRSGVEAIWQTAERGREKRMAEEVGQVLGSGSDGAAGEVQPVDDGQQDTTTDATVVNGDVEGEAPIQAEDATTAITNPKPAQSLRAIAASLGFRQWVKGQFIEQAGPGGSMPSGDFLQLLKTHPDVGDRDGRAIGYHLISSLCSPDQATGQAPLFVRTQVNTAKAIITLNTMGEMSGGDTGEPEDATTHYDRAEATIMQEYQALCARIEELRAQLAPLEQMRMQYEVLLEGHRETVARYLAIKEGK